MLWCVTNGLALAPPAIVLRTGVFDFEISFRVEKVADRLDNARTHYEVVFDFGVYDKVHVTLTVTQIVVFKPVEFFGKRQKRLRE